MAHPWHFRFGFLPSFVVLVAVLAAVPAAAMTVHEARCRTTIAESYYNAVKWAHRAVTKCHKYRGRGRFPASTDCNDLEVADPLTGNNLAEAESHLETKLAAHCKDVPAVLAQFSRCPSAGSATDDGGPTAGIDSFDELKQCLLVHLHDIVERNALMMLGSPDVPLDRYAAKCHLAIGKYSESLVRRIFRYRLECQIASDDSGGPIDYTCATYDDYESIPEDIAKSVEKVAYYCATSAEVVDSCANTAAGIAECAIRETAAPTGGGLVAMAWELPGTCPGAIRLRFDRDLETNDVDTGWSGLNHDAVPIGGYDAAQYSITCDEDCLGCTGSSPSVPAENCRCEDDHSVECNSNTDCETAGGNCVCYLAPPTHVSTISAPYCAMTPIDGAMSGTLDIEAGAASLDVRIRQRLGYGPRGITGVCPVCIGGLCDGGARDGLACDVDAQDASFGPTSFDCPPSSGWSLNGYGTPVSISLTTGPVSVAFDLPCDAPFEGLSCACSTCSLDNSIGCNGDEDCAGFAAGVCRTDGLHDGEPRRPNSCSDQICTSDPASPGEGICENDPPDLFCSGMLKENGRGMLPCAIDADCDTFYELCPNLHCGTCSVAEPRNCFVDPVATAPENHESMAGVGCMPPTLKSTLDQAYGIPGPFRIVQAFSLHRPMCSDGVTPFEAPGGSNCP